MKGRGGEELKRRELTGPSENDSHLFLAIQIKFSFAQCMQMCAQYGYFFSVCVSLRCFGEAVCCLGTVYHFPSVLSFLNGARDD